ncbi:hypothetical protein JTE90_018402 [Oedothorax gibbosus]|nr:hypothetical protein JTE90_018402 [Oedothorax gibbosus]
MLSHPISPIPSPPYQKIGSGMSPLNYEPVSPDYLPPPDSPSARRIVRPCPQSRSQTAASPWRGSSSRHHSFRRTSWRPPYTRLASGLIEPHFHAKSRKPS